MKEIQGSVRCKWAAIHCTSGEVQAQYLGVVFTSDGGWTRRL